jgi:hypothetical protein
MQRIYIQQVAIKLRIDTRAIEGETKHSDGCSILWIPASSGMTFGAFYPGSLFYPGPHHTRGSLN